MNQHVHRNWLQRYFDDLGPVGSIAMLAIAVFVFFKAFFDAGIDNLTTEILAALLGSILTVMITMLLIKRQGSIEQAHEAAGTNKTKVFEKKLELFREFISIYTRSAMDGFLDPGELGRLEELALSISLFTKDVPIGEREEDLGEQICRFVLQLEMFGLEESLEKIDCSRLDHYLKGMNGEANGARLLTFVEILRLMKMELGIAQSDTVYLDGAELASREYRWAEQLLAYRGYREQPASLTSPADGGGASVLSTADV
jgi:hypothetical protein